LSLSKTDHDLLIRIDERTEALEKYVLGLDKDVEKLKSWKNKSIGAISILWAVVGYLIYIISKLFELFKN